MLNVIYFGRLIFMKSVKVNTFLNSIKTLIALVFPLITFPYVSRILLPEGIGKVNFAASIISYFSIIAGLGINQYGIRQAAKLRDNKIILSQFVKEVFVINIISTFVSYFLLALLLIFAPQVKDYRLLIVVTGFSILFTTFGMGWLCIAIEDYLFITIRTILFQIISIILMFVLVRTKDDYIIYAAITVFSSVGSDILNFVHLRKYINFKTGLPLQLKQHLKPILILFAMAMTTTIYTALDTTMLGLIKGDREAGIYTAATKLNKIVVGLVTAAGSVLMPRLSYYYEKGNEEEFQRLAYKGFDFLFLISMPCMVGLSVLSVPLIHLLAGIDFDAAVTPMRIMNPIIVIIGLGAYIGLQMFLPLNKEKWTLYSVICGAVINFSMNMFLIPRYGACGAAVATVCAEGTVSTVQLFLARKFLKLKPLLFSFLKYTGNALIMGIIVFISVYFFESEVLQLVIGIFIGVIIYFVLLLLQKNELLITTIKQIKDKIISIHVSKGIK